MRLAWAALLLPIASLAAAAPRTGAAAGTGATASVIVSPEGPALAAPGRFRVGTTSDSFAFRDRLRLVGGTVARGERVLHVRVWFPMSGSAGRPVHYDHVINSPQRAPLPISKTGTASEGGTPDLAEGPYPVIVLSHGFGGWSTHMSHLAEHLASRGYVVVAPDHEDPLFKDVPGFAASFASVLVNRSRDQRDLIDALVSGGRARPGWRRVVDTSRVGLIGYSMGGFGALASAGASYDPASPVFASLPPEARRAMLDEGPKVAAKLGAVVLMAPWGGQPTSRVWTLDALSSVKAPVLMIDGDNDDVVDYAHGVSWIYDNLKATDRLLLTYHDARHNIAGDPAPPGLTDFDAVEFFNEPVWRQERINAINEHFITAFLDRALRQDVSADTYLAVPTREAGDGIWPLTFGTMLHGRLSGAGEPGYWPGFPRNWALGIALDHARRGTIADIETINRRNAK